MRIVKKLLDVCDFQGGTQPPKEEWISKATNGYVRMLQIRDYSQGAEKFIQYVKDNKSLHKCKEDDIMLSRYGYIGQVFTGLAGAYNVALVKVVKKCNIETQYLLYYFQSDYFKHSLLSNVGARATIPGFNKSELATAQIPVPSTEEQRRISKILSSIDQTMEKYNQQLSALDELIKSRFIELFGDRYINNRKWESKPLHECADFYNGKAHEQVVDKNGEYILVTSRCIASDITDYRRTNALLFPLQVNDIAMVMSDVPNGRALAKCILIDEDRKYTLNQRICCLRNYSFNPVFFYHLLNRHEYFLSFNDGNAQTNLRKDDLLACSIIMPPKELQEQFATFVGQTDKSKMAVKQSLEKLETLKKSLMQQYFG